MAMFLLLLVLIRPVSADTASIEVITDENITVSDLILPPIAIWEQVRTELTQFRSDFNDSKNTQGALATSQAEIQKKVEEMRTGDEDFKHNLLVIAFFVVWGSAIIMYVIKSRGRQPIKIETPGALPMRAGLSLSMPNIREFIKNNLGVAEQEEKIPEKPAKKKPEKEKPKEAEKEQETDTKPIKGALKKDWELKKLLDGDDAQTKIPEIAPQDEELRPEEAVADNKERHEEGVADNKEAKPIEEIEENPKEPEEKE